MTFIYKCLFGILGITLLSVSSLAYAETCPTPMQIKEGRFSGWQVLDIDNAEPLSDSALQEFKDNVSQFSFAGWLEGAPEGEGECFYDEELDVYLAKNTGKPILTIGNWKQTKSLLMKCDERIDLCRFETADPHEL